MEKQQNQTQKIRPFLWFNDNAEEAMEFYVSIFKNAKIKSRQYQGKEELGKKRTFFTGIFEVEGQEFMVLNGGPHFAFTPAISLFVNCETQAEVDELWEKLSEGGSKERCGWLRDKFGLSWQIVPSALGDLMYNQQDAARSANVMQAMLQMDKLDIAKLQQAYAMEPVGS